MFTKILSRCATRSHRLKPTVIQWVLAFCLCGIFPELHAFRATPQRLVFTGMLVSLEEQSRKGLLENLYVSIGKEKRIFLLDEMKVVGDGGINRATLQRLFPPAVRFIGPDNVVLRLESPESAGKVVTIEGLLYTGSRTLFIIRVDDNENVTSGVGARG